MKCLSYTGHLPSQVLVAYFVNVFFIYLTYRVIPLFFIHSQAFRTRILSFF